MTHPASILALQAVQGTWNSDMKFFCNFLILQANLVGQNQLEAFGLNNIVEIPKNMTEIAKKWHEFWRALEPRICNFLHRFTKCIRLRSILVNNLGLASVRIPLFNTLP